MNAKAKKVTAEFGPDTRFELIPTGATPFRVVLENTFEALKNRLLRQRLELEWEGERVSLIRRAAHEAASLARLTAYPSLFFPVLFEEKVQSVQKEPSPGLTRKNVLAGAGAFPETG